MKIFPLSLFRKALAATLAILLPILITFLYGYEKNKAFLKRSALTSVSSIAEAYEGQLIQFLEMSKRRAVDFSSDGFIRDELKRHNDGDKHAASRLRGHLLKNKIVLDKTINRICVLNLEGRIVASTEAGAIGNSLAGEEFFGNAKGSATVAERFNKRRGVSELAVGVPLTDKTTGAPIGVIVNFIEFTEFSRILSGLFSKELGARSSDRGRPAAMDIYLVNKDRLMMTESKFMTDAPMKQSVDTPPVERCLSFKQGHEGFYKNYRGREVVGASMCMPGLGWTLLVEVDTETALAPVSDMQRDAVIAGGIVFALIGVFFAFFFKSIVRRIRVLSSAAAMMSRGDYGVTVPVTSGDEIGMLSDSFNTMTREIKKRAEKVRVSEDRLRAVVDNSSAVIYLKDVEGRYLLANRSYARLIKQGREEMIGKTDFDFFSKGIAQAFRQNDLKVLEEKKAMEFEEVLTADGGLRYAISIKAPLFDAEGRAYGVCGISTDITERKMREVELKLLHDLAMTIGASEDFHAALKIAVVRICKATGWTFGEAWLSKREWPSLDYVFGWPDDENGKKGFIELSRGMTIEAGAGLPGRVWVSKAPELVKDVSADGAIFLRSDAARAAGFKAAAGFPITTGGGVLAVLVFFIAAPKEEDAHLVELVSVAAAQLGSVLMRKLAEEQRGELQFRYEGLVNNLTAGVFRCSMSEDGRFIEANPAAIYMLGATSKDELLKRGICDFYCDGKKKEDMKERLFDEGRIKNEEFELTTLKGGHIWVSLSAAAKEDKAGAVYCDGIMVDITEKKSLEEQLRQSQKIEAIGRLAGGVAHDFNNILTAVIGYGNMLIIKRGADETVKGFAEHILTLADKAAHLTHGLLAFSRKQVMNLRPVDINELVRSVQQLLARLIGEDIELKADLFDKALVVMADSIQLEQALINLATNARDAMPQGGALAVSTGIAELDAEYVNSHGYGAPGRYVLITVSDSGAGMDADTRKRIFEPFFTTKEIGKGTGLGLSIVYGIIKQHNGYINVYSEPGKGTSFRIYIPLAQAPAEELKPVEHAPVRGGSETILLAEDEAEVLDITKKTLTEFGYTVIAAVDGEDAVVKFREKGAGIDLVILDMVMPKKGGPEAYAEIKKFAPDVKVLFTSGYAEEMMRAAGLARDTFNFISKPAAPGDFLRKVREVLDNK
ncbi:MAG: PAS domain S-box protein [Deltaproteobacteria bacterium]|nr:PAS domain S-box protein [Deltaproteobacteria bacterium]